MKFLADECCDAPLVDALRQDGYDVLYAVESLRGATDDEVLACAFSEQRFLLTEERLWRVDLPFPPASAWHHLAAF